MEALARMGEVLALVVGCGIIAIWSLASRAP